MALDLWPVASSALSVIILTIICASVFRCVCELSRGFEGGFLDE